MDSIAKTGRATQGVYVIKVGAGDSVASLATIEMGAGSGNGGRTAAELEGEQPELEGLEQEEAPEEPEAPPRDRNAANAKKPVPIKGRKKPGGGKPRGRK